jgi:hypothetical protein
MEQERERQLAEERRTSAAAAHEVRIAELRAWYLYTELTS